MTPVLTSVSYTWWDPKVVDGGGVGGNPAHGAVPHSGANPSSTKKNANLHREQRRLDDLVFQSGIRLAQSTRKALKVSSTVTGSSQQLCWSHRRATAWPSDFHDARSVFVKVQRCLASPTVHGAFLFPPRPVF